MIKLNGREVKITRFPDNSVKFDLEDNPFGAVNEVEWFFESMEELFLLTSIVDMLKGSECNLFLPYLPNARMDKVQNDLEGFMLKHFVETLDNLGFGEITMLDPHSEVYKKWAKKTKWTQDEDTVKDLIDFTIHTVQKREDFKSVTLVYPDKGARNRYAKLLNEDNHMYGVKERNQATGEILSFDLVGDTPEGPVLIVDDICSKGGTFFFTAKKLRENGFKGNIYLYITHAENAIRDGELLKEDSEIKRVFTTNSILIGDANKTTIYEL